jgi:nucleoside-triphosphatase THEP1
MTKKTTEKPKHGLTYDNPFFQHIYSNIYNKKRNAMLIVCGSVGTGKSYAALHIAEQLDPTFNKDTLKDRLVLSPEQFMEMINRTEHKLKRGQVIIIDEASTQMYNRQWSSVNNQMINFIVTTFRHRGLICIMTVPYMDFLDSNVRRLFDYFVETKKIIFRDKQTKVKVYRLSYNKMKADKPYKKFFRRRDEDGVCRRMDYFLFDKCSDELGEQYEEYATVFKNTIAKEALEKAMMSKEAKVETVVDIKEMVNKVLENKKRYFTLKQGRPNVRAALIEADFNVGRGYSHKVKELAEATAIEQNLINI